MDWDTVICIPTREWEFAKAKNAALEEKVAFDRVTLRGAVGLLLATLFTIAGFGVYTQYLSNENEALRRSTEVCDTQRQSMSDALTVLSRTHASLLEAKETIGRIGSDQAWGRKFHVTQYAPSAGGINADRDPSTTSTMRAANPAHRIVAVDPAVVPYGSWIWIEDLGWFEAQDTGGAIKGFKLDVMVPRSKEAMQWGRQDRFALVVPPQQGAGS